MTETDRVDARTEARTDARPVPPHSFAHPAEAEFAAFLDFYRIRWMYEPKSFPLRWRDDRPAEMFTPDFYLPEQDLYIELTTMKQSLVTRKNRKMRRLRELYPDVNVLLIYRKNYHELLSRFGYGSVDITWIRIIAFGLCLVLAGAMVLFLRKSRLGQAIRATAQDPRAARVLGVDTDLVYSLTFSINAAICGAAGVIVGMIWVLQPFYGIGYSVRAFVIVTAAGLGNLPGVILAALGLGVVEQYSGFLLGAQFQQATIVGLLLVILLCRTFVLRRQRLALQ